ncbi:UNVERIFIED_CONTAM: 3-dehydroquinate synthase [Streptococcus canis]|uniref:3-dehydroquinate synthase n=1 Tax=Streptococcus canis TaxID=1329 RepID=UPI0024DE2904|nr:3-dehydroquinate synthase [Streptococcus canis]
MPQTLHVHSRVKDYDILFTNDVLKTLADCLGERKQRKLLFITDQTVYDLYQPLFEDLGQQYTAFVHICPPGGQSKSLERASAIYDQLIAENFSKKDMIITIGGGVIGDLGGFVAATFYRGIPYIQIPTTLLSQVDSSIGGKVGVHFKGLTNMIGSIYPPEAILISTTFLNTLPQREFSCGISEMLKIGFIHDRPLFQQLLDFQKENNEQEFEDLIYQSISNKKRIVEQDEFENGLRMSLNFGHTLGHAIESLCHHDFYHHGEAIAIGMVIDAKLATSKELLPKEDLNSLVQAFERYQLPTTLERADVSAQSLFDVLKTDKKNSDQHIIFILPTDTGFTTLAINKDDQAFVNTLEYLL